MNKAQVSSQHYANKSYLTMVRSMNHWIQAKEVSEASLEGESVLEIGPGTGHTSWLLKLWGHKVTTVDIDESLKPDIISDIKNLNLEPNSYDIVLAAEILEHLPYDNFEEILKKLGEIAKHAVVITLPAPLIGMSLMLNITGIQPFGLTFGIPYLKKHAFDGQHYWELGKRGYSLKRIKKSIKSSGLKITKCYRPKLSLYCYMFVLEPNPHKT